ncbi:MAG: hypothetical protein AAF004_13190 [Pseudomonadota bacterium]
MGARTEPAEMFGCDICFPDDIELAGKCWYKVPVIKALIAESHFSIKVRQCNSCGQRFVTVFAEMIDWQTGEDPQQCCALPITELEAARLLKAGSDAEAESIAESLGANRRSFSSFWPSGKGKSDVWSTGFLIGMHD